MSADQKLILMPGRDELPQFNDQTPIAAMQGAGWVEGEQGPMYFPRGSERIRQALQPDAPQPSPQEK